MGNSKNKKVPKKRKASHSCNTSSDQKENMPKTAKTRINKPNPDDGIEMSKQLLLKKKNHRTQRRSSSKAERVCPNGKPIPSLSELEKMFEESDEDDQTPKSHPTTSTPEKQRPTSEKNLLSPTTINKISERLLGSIQQQKLPDPSEVLEATALLREKSPPPPPIIPPKKKKKTEIPYIVGCKDRPQVIRKPNTNFCKGDDDYGVEPSSDDPEEQVPAKRAKKSKIPKYSKSIFNAHSDEIAERLVQNDAGDLSDASSDSNKTIKYEPTLVQNPRPQSFSPLPSTSRDTETFERNDEMFNVSLQETQRIKEILKKNDEMTDESFKEINTTKDLTSTEIHDTQLMSNTTIKQDDFITNKSTPLTLEDSVTDVSIFKGTDEVEIIDIPYDTIVIDDICERKPRKEKNNYTIDDSVIEVINPAGTQVIKSENQPEIISILNDEDCMIVPNSDTVNNSSDQFKLNEPIVIDDEYSSINMDFDSYDNEPIEIIDVDDVIAENKTILDKWKNSQELTKINTVVDVPTTYRNVTAVQPTVISSITEQTTLTHSTSLQASEAPSTSLQASVTPSTTLQTNVAPSSTLQSNVAPGGTLQASVTPSSTLQTNVAPSTALPTTSAANPVITNRSARNSQNNKRQRNNTNIGLGRAFQRILGEFFADLSASRPQNNIYIGNHPGRSVTTLVNLLPSANTTTESLQNTGNMQCPIVDLNISNIISSNSGTTSTNMPPATPASPIPQRNLGDCPICLDPIGSKKGIASTICGHVFCLSCIQQSIKGSGKKCPTCRKSLKGVGYHQLYL